MNEDDDDEWMKMKAYTTYFMYRMPLYDLVESIRVVLRTKLLPWNYLTYYQIECNINVIWND